jgi:hypothetical protein
MTKPKTETFKCPFCERTSQRHEKIDQHVLSFHRDIIDYLRTDAVDDVLKALDDNPDEAVRFLSLLDEYNG